MTTRLNKYIALILLIGLAACAAPNNIPPVTVTNSPLPPTPMTASSKTTPIPTPVLPPPQFVDIGGRKLAYACAGEGSPTVIIEPGGNLAGLASSWNKVFEGVSKETRVCVYDRANAKNGLSDPAPTPLTSLDIAHDLHALLAAARISPPYILVAHSMGGFHVRVYNGQYPSEVAGMVLVDSSVPYQWVGLLPVMPTPSADEAEEISTMRKQLINSGKSSPTKDFDMIVSSEQVNASGDLGDKPLVVITRDPNTWTVPSLGPVWEDYQRQLAQLSTRGVLYIVPNSNHGLYVTHSEVLIQAIVDMARELRP